MEFNEQKKEAFFLSKLSRVARKPDFCVCYNKGADQLCSHRTAAMIIAFVFATQIVQPIDFLNPKFQAASRLL